MASKRTLYKPAQVQENIGHRKNRKTLAQGRLITGSSQGPVAVVRPEVSSVSHVTSSAGNVSRLEHTSLVQGRPDDSTLFSPRREAPQVSERRLAELSDPAGSLDLSDSDADASRDRSGRHELGGRSRYQQPAEVLCIDASRQTYNPDVSEVDIRIGIDRSPVKIICHSPAAVKLGLRQQQHESSERIKVDCLPSGATSQQNGHGTYPTPAVLSEKLAGSHIDPYTAVQAIPMSPACIDEHRHVFHTLPSNLPQPNFDDSPDADRRLDEDDRLSAVSDGDACSLNEYVGSSDRQPKGKSPTSDRPPAEAKKETQKKQESMKKMKGRIVPSRYLQAVETKAKASLSARMDKSSMEKHSKSSHSMDSTRGGRKVARKQKPRTTEPQSARGTRERSSTPENQSMISDGQKTSTPTMEMSLFDIDASAIHPEVSMLAAGDSHQLRSHVGSGRTRSRLRPNDVPDDTLCRSTLSNMSTVSSKPKQKLDARVLQQQLDLLRMYDLQWTFLESRAKKSFEEQEKQAMAQIYGVYEEVEKLRKIKAEKEQQYARLRHENMTDNLTEIQRQCLGPVTGHLATLQQQYRSLAAALDTTRHQIQTRNIHLPSNEDQFQATLEAQLLESERLLGEISATTRHDTPNISTMANAMVAMETAVDGMESELTKSRELLAATESLTMHECSLRVQEMQLLDKS